MNQDEPLTVCREVENSVNLPSACPQLPDLSVNVTNVWETEVKTKLLQQIDIVRDPCCLDRVFQAFEVI